MDIDTGERIYSYLTLRNRIEWLWELLSGLPWLSRAGMAMSVPPPYRESLPWPSVGSPGLEGHVLIGIVIVIFGSISIAALGSNRETHEFLTWISGVIPSHLNPSRDPERLAIDVQGAAIIRMTICNLVLVLEQDSGIGIVELLLLHDI